MSHNVRYKSYEENVNRAKVQKFWDEYAANEDYQEGCSGLNGSIKWKDGISPLQNYDKAREWIETNDSGCYDQLAVRYYEYPSVKSSKKEELEKKLYEQQQKIHELSNTVHYEGVSSAYVSCKKCGSKINSQYFGKTVYNLCPVCKEDLRPESALAAINAAKEKAKKIDAQCKVETERLQKKCKPTVRWLVKIEYHT